MRAPDFWWRPPGLIAALLAPLGMIYGAVTLRRMARPGAPAPVPVVCIGNFTAGGAGKTPVAIAVTGRLGALGHRPAFLTRGYGAKVRQPLLVDPARHDAGAVGDEALLLARHAPVIVSPDRAAGARLAAETGADVIVMDDGLQNPSLAKQLSIAVIDGGAGFGNGHCMPAGPLRAPVAGQAPYVDRLITIGPGGAAAQALAAGTGLPLLHAALMPDPEAAAALSGHRLLAFAGIGRPGKFFETLTGLGLEPAMVRAFADHHVYTPAEIGELVEAARSRGLLLVTTEKDMARLGRDAPAGLRSLPVSVTFSDPAAVDAALLEALQRWPSSPTRRSTTSGPA